MKKAALQIAALAGALILFCVVCRLCMRDTYMAYVRVPDGVRSLPVEKIRISPERADVITYGAPERVGEYLRVPIMPQGRGRTFVNVDFDAQSTSLFDFRVSGLGTIYDGVTGGFTGDTAVLAAVTAFCLAVAVIMLRVFREATGPRFYAYSTLHAAGFSLFALLTGLLMLYVTLRHAASPRDYSMISAYSAINSASFAFMMATAPFMVVFEVALAVSNIALLRHEGFRPHNVLAISVSAALAAGEALAFYLYTRDFAGSEWEWRIRDTLQCVYATGYAYFECVLIGAMICGLKAARHVPGMGVDYLLILGCKFRKDGTLTPLLRGRVDRAVDFWRAQKAATGREAVLVPSGGQGADEPMAEAEAMRRYLLEQGVPEHCIMIEDRSRNTFQNMAYSKALIDRIAPGARVAYATTNYHVFRSGVWANKACMPAEGMGSGTKWWYWPNAFMRECAGLLLNRIPQESLMLIALILFFGALSMALR